jgi:polar amino acid transport system permease protein
MLPKTSDDILRNGDGMNGSFDWKYTLGLFADVQFYRAAGLVIILSVMVWVTANVLGIVLALMKESKSRSLRALAGCYIWFFRSLPLLVLLIFVYNMPQAFPWTFVIVGSAFQTAFVAMVLNHSAYMAEIHRGGLLAVGVEQREAAKALGLPDIAAQRLVVIPQAFRVALPALANEFTTILKLTSLASIVSLTEILLIGQRLYTQNFLVLETLVAVSVYYVALVSIFDQVRNRIEFKLDVRKRKTTLAANKRGEDEAKKAPHLEKRHRARHPHSGEIVVRVRDVSKAYNETRVLHPVDLDIHRGEVVVVVGPSGSGKTTLLRTLNHLESRDTGLIEVGGKPLGGSLTASGSLRLDRESVVARQRQDIGMVFQSFNLFPHKTILENVLLAPIALKKIMSKGTRDYGLSFLNKVGLSDHADKYPHQLSGGQQQRVAIARALALKPTVMLFDEPTSALDPELTGEVLDAIIDLADGGMTMVIVTHDMRLARNVADWVVFMEHGHIIAQGAPEEVFGCKGGERMARFVSHIA